MQQKKTILIFGISSLLGSNLAQQLKGKYRIIGTYFNTQVKIKDVLSVKCDVHNKSMVQKISFIFKPDITIYAVGLSRLNDCQDFPRVADALNTAGVFNVSQSSERYGSKFIYFSNSYIFSGENILTKENDSAMPMNVYGNTAASSEFFIQKSCLNYIIFRCSPFIGRSYNYLDLSWTEVIERSNFLNQKMNCDHKVKTGFIDFETLALVVDLSIQNNITNRLFQVSSKDVMTRYDFTREYLEIFEGNKNLSMKGDWYFPRSENKVNMQSNSHDHTFHMDVSNVEETFDIKMPSIKEAIKKYQRSLKGAMGSVKVKSDEITFI